MRDRLASLTLEEPDAVRATALLDELIRETDARRALLVDRNGHFVVGTDDGRGELDPTAFASLAAADFAANEQLASLLGEQEFSSLFHQGERESIFMADVAGRLILVVLFDRRSTLGMVRIRARAAARDLAAVVREMLGRAPASPLETAWAHEAEDEIDRLFGSW